MSIKQSLDKWIAEFESDGMCDISDQQVIALIRGYSALEAKCAALAAENAGLNAFVDALLSIAWQGGSADGAEIQDLALKHGLLRQEVYSADEHENQVDDQSNFEDGDPVYFRVKTPATDAFLAEVRAQGVEMSMNRIHETGSLTFGDCYIALNGLVDEILRKGVQS